MAIRKIVTKEDPLLKKRCRDVVQFNERLWVLLDDMRETLDKFDGAGIAAPQVGVLRRAMIIMEGDEDDYILTEAVNPELLEVSGEQYDVEGCLSCPDDWGYVTRPM
ncbi:MAG: peptide deformylase, partial [Oscillospiraceae bacterium]|nr:peptide deformylase [Oscillospiraceae bacterium]